MPQRPTLGSLGFGRKEWEKEVDLGGGRTARPEDLLEGHFQRLAGRTSGSVEVNVQVSPSESTVLRVSAPALAPLAEIAEELASRIPTIQPASGFRHDLHRSLEEAHRRQMEARRFESTAIHAQPTRLWLWLALGILAILAAGLWLSTRNRSRS